MAGRSAVSRLVADTPERSEDLDLRFRELLDHVAVDLGHMSLGVPQPGVSEGTAVRRQTRSQEE